MMKWLALATISCLVAACGGGDKDKPKTDDKDTPKTDKAAAPEPTPKPEPVPTPEPKPEPAKPADKPADDKPAAPAEKPAEKFDFDKLSHDDKMKFMKEKVVPAMKTAFQDFNAKKFAKFDCKTCHGKDPKGSKYKMPSPDLPKLDWAALKAGKEKKMAEFMAKTVKPQMAKLLEQPEMTETEPKGFGCLECHEEKK
jgi:hypothetical protein